LTLNVLRNQILDEHDFPYRAVGYCPQNSDEKIAHP
jgi:hypothetical protein